MSNVDKDENQILYTKDGAQATRSQLLWALQFSNDLSIAESNKLRAVITAFIDGDIRKVDEAKFKFLMDNARKTLGEV